MSKQTFRRRSPIAAPASELFAWHAREGAFERLSPPWERVRVRSRSGTIKDGDTLDLEVKLGPVPLRWRARHQDYEEGRQFCDIQEGGPFKLWKHVHRVEGEDGSSVLDDDITYELPLSPLSDLVAGGPIRGKFDRMFQFRHRTTRDDLEAHHRFGDLTPQRIAVTGASGLLGSNLLPFLTTGGHRVLAVRRGGETSDGPQWNPESFGDANAVVHLAGESIDGRWTAAKKQAIERSRVEGTARLIETLKKRDRLPNVIVCASAIGYYGDREDEWLPEDASKGEGFLSDVCDRWESALDEAAALGVRVVSLRFGVVISGQGGALSRMLPPFRIGAGGRIGSGRQFMSWIAIDDAVGAIHHALCDSSLTGPVNAVSPNPVTNRVFTKTLGHVLSRPTIVPLPAFAARAAFGEMADALLLSSARCEPRRLQDAGYVFRYPDLEDALRFQLGRMPVSE